MGEYFSPTAISQNLTTVFNPTGDMKSGPTGTSSDDLTGHEISEQAYKITLTILFSAVSFFGVFLNSIVVFTVYRYPEMRTPCNLLIVNIAVSDLAVASLAAPLRIIEVFVGWPFGDFMCRLLVPMQDLFVIVSVVTHTTIALERFRAIVRPLKRRMSLRGTKFVIIAIWPACYITSALPIAPIMKVQEVHGTNICSMHWPFELYRPIYGVYLVIVFIAIPLFIQTMAYFKILKTLQTRLVPLCALPVNRMLSRATQYRKRRRLIKTLAFLVLAFQVCYIPRGVMMLVYEFAKDQLNMTIFTYSYLMTLILFYLKHVMNPIILFAISSEFRRWNCLQTICH